MRNIASKQRIKILKKCKFSVKESGTKITGAGNLRVHDVECFKVVTRGPFKKYVTGLGGRGVNQNRDKL